MAVIAWFENLGLIPGAIVVIGGFTLFSVLFARVVGLLFPKELLREHNELAGFMFAVIGVIYAVILGFVAVGVWERFVQAEDRTYDEASALTAVYRDAGTLSNWQQLRHDVRSYVRYAVDVGWPALEAGKPLPDTLSAEHLSRDVRHTPVHNAAEQVLFGHIVERTSEALQDRDARVTEDSTGLNAVMWMVVFVGGFVTVAFSYLFGFQRSLMQTVMIGTLAFLIGLILFLMMSLDYPYRGAIRVGPDAFERALINFDQIDSISIHNPNARK